MKRALIAVLALLLALGLGGCASMLDHNYTVVQPHEDGPTSDGDVITAETYQQLEDAVIYFIDQGMSYGVVHLSNYDPDRGDVEADVDAACLYAVQEYPLGAYAVSYIKPQTSYIVSYYEVSVYISYRRTQDQVKSIVSVTGTSAIREELQDTLRSFGAEAVLRVTYFNEDEEFIRELVRQAYYDTPESALGMPEVTVSLYPGLPEGEETAPGGVRIVEIQLSYPEDPELLQKKKEKLVSQLSSAAAHLEVKADQAGTRTLFDLLRSTAQYSLRDEDGRRANTAYAALVEGRADSEGMALAYQLLCQYTGIECTVVSGTLDGADWYWNIVTLSDGESRHVDATRADGFALQDAEMAEQGYQWDREEFPSCGLQPAAEETILPSDIPVPLIPVPTDVPPVTAEASPSGGSGALMSVVSGEREK